MYEDVFCDDPWLLSEDCQNLDENKKRKNNIQIDNHDNSTTGEQVNKNNIQIDNHDNSTTGEQVNKKQKKRFIWPDSLHKDFLIAVFDIGLKNCTIKELKSTIDPKYESQLTMKQLQQYLNQLQGRRETDRSNSLSNYEESVNEQTMNEQTLTEEQTEEKIELQKVGVELAGNLIKKLEFINEKITQQTNCYATLKASLTKQQKVQYQLMNKIAQLDPRYNDLRSKVPLHISASGKSSPATIPPLIPNNHSCRAELQIMSDMRAQMDIHRRLLSRRQDHLSQSSIDANAADALAPRLSKPNNLKTGVDTNLNAEPKNAVPNNDEGTAVDSGDHIIDEWFGYDSLDMDIFSFLK